ncbi:MAG: adenine deaminase C-terminal domain-containing protein, partial [Patescibacteria group bacterium]
KNDILKIVVADRYGQDHVATSFIKGFGLKQGAMAATVAHDSHNIICIGTNDRDMVVAINELIKIKGGLLVVNQGKVHNKINLTIAGLMSTRHGHVIARKYRKLKKNAAKLGSTMTDPFMTMSFMALLVIPELKLSDRGLFDGKKWELIG